MRQVELAFPTLSRRKEFRHNPAYLYLPEIEGLAMGWLGTGIGAGIGWMLGGPLGAALGAWIGYALTDSDKEADAAPEANPQEIAHAAMFAMLAKLAKADGRITRSEADVINRFARETLELDDEDRERAKRAFRAALDDDAHTFQDYAAQFYQLFPGDEHQGLRDTFFATLFEVAAADHDLHPKERELLQQGAQVMRVSDGLFESLMHEHFGSAEAASLDEAYALLGVAPDAPTSEIKRAYRKKCLDYHPDRLASKGLPPDMIQYAEAQLRRINEAYERIMQARGEA
ncbi:MAG: molecular chaperone DjlA [Zetaproteobacteria bacterium]|nr:MAG: molecular chaperone DjlA [Zetaproteobacteria bacterium]